MPLISCFWKSDCSKPYSSNFSLWFALCSKGAQVWIFLSHFKLADGLNGDRKYHADEGVEQKPNAMTWCSYIEKVSELRAVAASLTGLLVV